MRNIPFPLEPPMQGAEVENLQEALQAFIDKVVTLRDQELAARQEMSALLQRERLANRYGDVTAKFVSTFQKERQLQETGIVDKELSTKIFCTAGKEREAINNFCVLYPSHSLYKSDDTSALNPQGW